MIHRWKMLFCRMNMDSLFLARSHRQSFFSFSKTRHLPLEIQRSKLHSLSIQKRGTICTCRQYARSFKSIRRQKLADSRIDTECVDYKHISWWQEKMHLCKKPVTKELTKRLSYSNILGLNENLKCGKIKEGSLNSEILQAKLKFPREVLLCRVGEFYEATGFDACILVEYAGLNPMGGAKSESVPKAGCPIMNLRQTLDDLTRNGFSVCVIEEVQGPTQSRCKDRFISGHAHPGSPYVYGLAGADIDIDFSEPMPVIGLSHTACGYSFISVLEAMQTYSAEDGLTEEAIVAKLRARPAHMLFLHSSLKNNSSGTAKWSAFGEGGSIWGECCEKHYEWYGGDPVLALLSKVRDIFGLTQEHTFRNITPPAGSRPRALYLGTATHIGVIPTEGIPSLLKVLLLPDTFSICVMYLKDLLLNPPSYKIASCIQAICRLMSEVSSSVPDFTCVPAAKLAKLIAAQEMNHIEFWRIRNIAEDVIQMYQNDELACILEKLLDPTSMSTGLQIDKETLVKECREIAAAIYDVVVPEGEPQESVNCFTNIPNDFFVDMELSWRNRVKRVHAETVFTEVDEAAKALSLAVEEDFVPILRRIKSISNTVGFEPKGEISYAKEHVSVWFKGRQFSPSVWANTPGEEQIKSLHPAQDSKAKKAGSDWHTTEKVEKALMRYREAAEHAKLEVTNILKELASQMQTKLNTIIFISVLSVIAQTLFSHVCEGMKRMWVFPTLSGNEGISDNKYASLKIEGLLPYWINSHHAVAVNNDISMQSLFLLTGPNGGGKSSLLRSIGATALLGICGLMVPANRATIPHFDSIFIQMGSYDSPADGKSSFQVEMSEMRSVISQATSRSLVLIDEICRGTEVERGTCVAASIIEKLDSFGCIGIISTHLHRLLGMSLKTKRLACKAMGTQMENGQVKPTWKLLDGVCNESLAFETAKREGLPEDIIQRAEELYLLSKQDQISKESQIQIKARNDRDTPIEIDHHNTVAISNGKLDEPKTKDLKINFSGAFRGHNTRQISDAHKVFLEAFEERLLDLFGTKNCPSPIISYSYVGAREQPPPNLTNCSCVYILQRPDGKYYVGETDDLAGRIGAHRSIEGLRKVPFLYAKVPGKSAAREIETFIINRLLHSGFELVNKADQSHQNFGVKYLAKDAMPF